jgi:hypothetical protein
MKERDKRQADLSLPHNGPKSSLQGWSPAGKKAEQKSAFIPQITSCEELNFSTLRTDGLNTA